MRRSRSASRNWSAKARVRRRLSLKTGQGNFTNRPEPEVRAFDIAFGKCTDCGRKYRGQHPEVAPDQTGATAHRVHPEVYALAHTLHDGYAMPQRKVARALKTFFWRHARPGVVYTDDTGWRIGGVTAFLMAFDSDLATVYQIRSRPRHDEVLEVIGENFAGSLSTDRERSYDAEALKRALDAKRRIRDPENRKLLQELRWHYERGRLLRHLKNPEMEPTNNRAERALRPAVIARKVSHGSKNEARAQASRSVLETARKKGLDLVESVREACAGANPFAPAPEIR